ncbi:ABC transporter permease, partial [Ralstonia solanacearum]|uniref:ABC transporter permease n=1 Tax=Ralstonia solanacearum TaxID=305 RepID=UPI0018C1D800
MNVNGKRFSLHRWWSVVLKEFLQLRRDRVTFAMMIGIPIMQLLMFGFAINTDPKHLLTGVIAADQSEFTRSFLASLRNTDYFHLAETLPDEAAGREALAEGRLQFIVSIPPDFTRRLVRGEHPALLVEADATDPSATGLALASVTQLAQGVVSKDMKGALAPLAGGPPP